MPVAFGINQLKDTADNMYESISVDDYNSTLSSETEMYANDGTTLLAKFFAQDRIVVPLDKISKNLQNAIIAREDRRFYEHSGVDLMGMLRGAIKSSSGSEVQGGSTLTQQYIKNLLIDNALQVNDPIKAYHAKEQTLFRKIKEAKLALEIETKLSKEQILEGYLNVAPFGPNVYGAESSALRYFSKHATDLTINESALIASVTKSPVDYDPIKFPEVAQNERDTVLMLMLDQGMITKEEYDKDVAVPVKDMLHISEVPVGCQTAGNAAFFCDYVTQIILNSNLYGKTKTDRMHFLYQSGLKIYTTIDLRAQDAAQNAVNGMVPPGDPSGLEDAISVVEPGTGKVLAMAQNRPYNAAQSDPNALDTAINYNVGQDYNGSIGFTTGSAIKLVAVTDWIRNGHSLYDSATLAKVKYPFSTAGGYFACASPFASWRPKNYAGHINSSTPITGFNLSYNIPMIQIAGIDGMCSWADTANRLGISDELLGDYTKSNTLNPSMVIGAVNITPLVMATGFSTIASGGIRCNPIAITKIVDNDGKELSVPNAKCERTIDEDVAKTMQWALGTNVTGGVARGAAVPGYQMMAKTGTAENDSYLTTGACVSRLCAYAWMGNAEFEVPLHSMKIGPRYYGRWESDSIARYLISPFFRAALPALGIAPEALPQPSSKFTGKAATPTTTSSSTTTTN